MSLQEFLNNNYESHDMDSLVKEAKELLKTDRETQLAYRALIELRILPSEFINMPPQDRAIVISILNSQLENNKGE